MGFDRKNIRRICYPVGKRILKRMLIDGKVWATQAGVLRGKLGPNRRRPRPGTQSRLQDAPF